MEMQKRKGDTPADTDHHDRARLIRSIVAEWIATLGTDKAWVRTGVVRIAPAVRSGHRQPGFPRERGDAGNHVPLNSASVWEQIARAHFAQTGM